MLLVVFSKVARSDAPAVEESSDAQPAVSFRPPLPLPYFYPFRARKPST
jgi:hypothetical protein